MVRRLELGILSSGRGAAYSLYSAKAVDLRHLTWNLKTEHSTAGAAPKARYGNLYYKLSSYNRDAGFYGDEAITECVVSDVLDTMNINHVRYSLVMGDILYRGVDYRTPVCISESFNSGDMPAVSIERYLESHCSGVKPFEACLSLGWASYVYTMFLIDFLIINRDRHGANIEVLDGNPVPLFDHGAALTALQDHKVWNHWSGDRVNNYVGSYSLRENLHRIPLSEWPKVSAPDLRVVERFSNFWPGDKITFVKQMLSERWKYIEQRKAGIV